MPGKIWTDKDINILKDRMVEGLNGGEDETLLLRSIAKQLKRTFMATRIFWQRYKADHEEIQKQLPRKEDIEDRESAEAEIGRDFINIVVSSRRITTVDAAIKHFNINMDEWEIERQKVKTQEGYRKDRRVQWEVIDGKTTHGKVDDSGKMLVVPLFHIQVTLKRRVSEVRLRLALDDMLADAAKRVSKPPKRKYARLPKGLWYELDFPDIHFGKETLAEESGQDYNIAIAREIVLSTFDRLLGLAAPHSVERIILPVGNDFFNVDNKENTTTHGTPQQEDTRWQKTFREGRRLAEDMVARCLEVAPVEIIVVPGNHDEQRAFYLGEVLQARYSNDKNVRVDNSAKKRKYLHFGRNLIGFTHGYWEKPAKLPSLMPLEEPEKWAASTHREFHLGDKHHKIDLQHRAEDLEGVTIRYLRSLSATDTWHFDKAYVGAPRAADGFLWDKLDGIVAQFPATLRKE